MFAFFTLVRTVSLQTQLMGQRVTMARPNGERVLCTKVVKGCPWEIEGVPLEANLIVFGILGFNVILEMDWLFRHFASIDCLLRTVTF